jgi:AcrR family transcriptional regulator
MEKPTSKRKEREREARREAILDAAARVFSRKSFFEATLEEIATEAELAKGTLYNYYKDKPDIFGSLIARGQTEFRENLEKAIAEGGSLEDMLRRIFEMSIRTMYDHKYMFRMILTAGEHLSDSFRSQMMKDWREQLDIAAGRIAEAFVAMQETHGLTPQERMAGAYLVLASIRSLHQRQMTRTDIEPVSDEIEQYTRLLCRALRVEQTA